MASNWAKLQQQIVCNPKKKQKSTGVVQGKTIGNINNGSKKTTSFHKETQSGIIRNTAASTFAINPGTSSGKRKLKVGGNECSKGNKRKKIHQQTSFPTDVPTTQVNTQQNNLIQNGRGDATQITSSTRHIGKQLETSHKKSKKKIKHKQAQIQSRKNDKSRSDCTHIEVSSNSQLPISATKAPTPFTIQANTCYTGRKFTTPQDCVCTKGSKKESVCVDAFKQCMAHSYRGFSCTSAEKIESSLHDSILNTLDDMVKKNYFHYDIVSAGKAVSSTFVQRVLVGERGMTYHYQRLRIFALPWDDDGTGVYQADTAKCESGRPVSNLLALKQLNSTLTTNATELLLQYHKEGGDKHNQQIAQKGVVPRGSCKYSVSLINYMFCEKDSKVPLKNEAVYGMGPTSVSWHADSSLQNYSTIAVYQITGNGPIAGSQNRTKRSSKTSDTTKGSEDDWSVAMRVVADDVTPAVACRLKSGETYYMMDDFNHHHHHAVIAPTGQTLNERNGWRFSSTHRVAVEVKDTYDYIRQKAVDTITRVLTTLCNTNTNVHLAAKDIQEIGHLHLELEFEWIRMFWLQGESHAQSHERYWLGCIQTLTHMWELSEAMLSLIVIVLGADVASEAGGVCVCVSKDVRTYAMTIYILREIRFRRREYAKRCKSQAYHFLEARNKPVENKLKYNIPLDRAGLEAYKHLDLPQGVSLFSHTQACRKGARTCAFTLPKDLSPTIEAIEEQKKAIFGKV